VRHPHEQRIADAEVPVSDTQQELELRRVSARINKLVLSFCRDRIATNQNTFHMTELALWVSRHNLIAPDSAGRILRSLRAKGKLDYIVVSRSESLYELKRVA
jgi:hypothetical protein